MKLASRGSTPAPTISSSIEAVSWAVSREQPDLRAHADAAGRVTIVFSDIERYTELTDRLGDVRTQAVLRAHNELLREQLASYGGTEVKSQGDGFMLAFAEPASARGVRAARSATRWPRTISVPASVACTCASACTCGMVIREGDDFYGRTVIVAARVASEAEGDEVLVTDAVAESAASAEAVMFEASREVGAEGPARSAPGASRPVALISVCSALRHSGAEQGPGPVGDARQHHELRSLAAPEHVAVAADEDRGLVLGEAGDGEVVGARHAVGDQRRRRGAGGERHELAASGMPSPSAARSASPRSERDPVGEELARTCAVRTLVQVVDRLGLAEHGRRLERVEARVGEDADASHLLDRRAVDLLDLAHEEVEAAVVAQHDGELVDGDAVAALERRRCRRCRRRPHRSATRRDPAHRGGRGARPARGRGCSGSEGSLAGCADATVTSLRSDSIAGA